MIAIGHDSLVSAIGTIEKSIPLKIGHFLHYPQATRTN